MATPTRTPFEFTGADGRPLRGDVRTAGKDDGRPAVVICHGFKGFKDWGFFPHLATRLAKSGLTAISFNFSGSGIGADLESFSEPERFARMTVTNDLHDLQAVCRRLRAGDLVPGLRPPRKLGMFGHSRGGGAVILHAARAHEVAALVTWAAVAATLRWDEKTIEQWRRDGKLDVVNARTGEVLPLYTDLLDDVERHVAAYDVARAAGTVAGPWLIVHGDADEAVPLAEGEKLRAAAASETTELRVIRHGGHTFGAKHPWAGSTRELDQAMDETVDWFTKWLL